MNQAILSTIKPSAKMERRNTLATKGLESLWPAKTPEKS
jgi:hypothetical protein